MHAALPPQGETQKRLEEDTECRIFVRGKGAEGKDGEGAPGEGGDDGEEKEDEEEDDEDSEFSDINFEDSDEEAAGSAGGAGFDDAHHKPPAALAMAIPPKLNIVHGERHINEQFALGWDGKPLHPEPPAVGAALTLLQPVIGTPYSKITENLSMLQLSRFCTPNTKRSSPASSGWLDVPPP